MPSRPARHFIDTQLDPAIQAFGYGGGWSVERRARRRHDGLEPLPEFAADLPPWPCANWRCQTLIRWNREMKGFQRYCTRRCYLAAWRARRRRGQRSPSEMPEVVRDRARRTRAAWDEQARERRTEVARRYWANLTAEQKHAKIRRDNQTRKQGAPRRREALAPLARELKAHGVSFTHLARRLGVTPHWVYQVFAGRYFGSRIVDMARRMLDEPPHPELAPLTEEERRVRELRRVYQREWSGRRNYNELRRAQYRADSEYRERRKATARKSYAARQLKHKDPAACTPAKAKS